MTVEELNRKAERLVILCNNRNEEKGSQRKFFIEVFGENYPVDFYDRYIIRTEYPQDKEINELNEEIVNGLRELGLSEIFTQLLDVEGYCNKFRFEYIPIKRGEYDS